jgi:hypothetical protein
MPIWINLSDISVQYSEKHTFVHLKNL